MAAPAWVTELGIVGTWIIAIAAIWGEKIRSRLFRPGLHLALLSEVGEFVMEAQPPKKKGGQAHFVPTRYFRLRVTNARSFPAAREVEVLLTKLEKRGPDGRPQAMYAGPLPLTWRHQEIYPRTRTIGHSTEADVELLSIQDGLLKLRPMLVPDNFPETAAGETHLWITAIARGLEGESAPLRLRIDWDGVWEHGDSEMASHFVISAEK